MKKIICFLFFVIASSASADFDNAQWTKQRDSAWKAISDYPTAFQWDSIYMLRWTSWSCMAINKREDDSRAYWNKYFTSRAEEDNTASPEYFPYDSIKFRKAQEEAGDRYNDFIIANLDQPNSWIYREDSLVRVRWDSQHTCEWIVNYRHKLDSILYTVRDENFKESMNQRYYYDTTPYADFDPDYEESSPSVIDDIIYWYGRSK